MNVTDELIKQITQAIAAHSFWPTHLRTAIEKRHSKHEPGAIRRADSCAFGRWLDKHMQELSDFPEFLEARDFHARFHAATSEVMELALAGESGEAKARLASDGDFGKACGDLTRAMISWKKRVKKRVAV